MNTRQSRYWYITIPHHLYTPYLSFDCEWIKGKLISTGVYGSRPNKRIKICNMGHEHEEEVDEHIYWYIVVCFKRKVRLRGVAELFGYKNHYESLMANEVATHPPSTIHGEVRDSFELKDNHLDTRRRRGYWC